MRRICIVFLLFVAFLTHSKAQNPSAKPNIVFIFADDLGYGDLGCYGNKVIKTPNLNRMAAQGMKFTDFYSASPVCSPSRAALMTGRYPIRQGINTVFFPESHTGIDASEVTIPEMLKGQGYTTACVGKWHLGHESQFLPTRHGFDYYFGIPYSNDMTPTPYLRNEQEVVAKANQDSTTIRYTQEALGFIEKNKNAPFFLYLPHNMPHVPIYASPAFKGKSKGGLYGDVIEELDWSVGEVLKKLKELKLEENTLVIFSSDNGPWLVKGADAGTAGTLREGKMTTFEGGMRVPAIAYWKGKIKTNSTHGQVANMMDWFPTFAKLTGGTVSAEHPIDGKDITGVLLGTGKRDGEEMFYYMDGKLQAYRSGNWKIKLPYAGNQGNKGMKAVEPHPLLLVDLSKDPGEKTNLAEKYPDKVAQMQNRMKDFEQSLGQLPMAKKVRGE